MGCRTGLSFEWRVGGREREGREGGREGVREGGRQREEGEGGREAKVELRIG